MISHRLYLPSAIVLASFQCVTLAAVPDFNGDIAPILVKRCLECHNEREAAGGLTLTTRDSVLLGGDSGEVIVPRR